MSGVRAVARFGDALASGADLVSAAERAATEAVRSLDGPANLVFFSVCGPDTEEVVLAGERVMGMVPGAVSIGCTSSGVIGGGRGVEGQGAVRSEEHTSELQSREKLVCRLLLDKKKASWSSARSKARS